jgi:hypothetical protein
MVGGGKREANDEEAAKKGTHGHGWLGGANALGHFLQSPPPTYTPHTKFLPLTPFILSPASPPFHLSHLKNKPFFYLKQGVGSFTALSGV